MVCPPRSLNCVLCLHQLIIRCGRDRVQTFEKDRGGASLDIDSLCSELKAKAKCHGTSAGIDEKDVNEILGRAAKEANV